MIKPKIDGCRVIFGPCRLSYTHLFHKHSFDGDDANGKYMTNVIIPGNEKETIDAINAAIEQARKNGLSGKWMGKAPKQLESPLKDGDDRDDELYAGNLYLNAKCSTRPGIMERDGKTPIVDEEDVYSGMWAIVSVTFFPYEMSGKKGISCGLNNILKWKDGERLGGRTSAEREFADLDLSAVDDDDL